MHAFGSGQFLKCPKISSYASIIRSAVDSLFGISSAPDLRIQNLWVCAPPPFLFENDLFPCAQEHWKQTLQCFDLAHSMYMDGY